MPDVLVFILIMFGIPLSIVLLIEDKKIWGGWITIITVALICFISVSYVTFPPKDQWSKTIVVLQNLQDGNNCGIKQVIVDEGGIIDITNLTGMIFSEHSKVTVYKRPIFHFGILHVLSRPKKYEVVNELKPEKEIQK